MISLVGYTGFVGSNILENSNGQITGLYNSKNVEEAYGTNPDVLIYSGLRAEKYLANSAPDKDMQLIIEAQNNIKKICPGKLVLISTIDVFKNPIDVDENSIIDTDNLHPYGYNRYLLENWVRENYEDYLIVRLPGLFGKGIKKNFIYDYINVIPFMLKTDKMSELSEIDAEIIEYYELLDNGFYRLKTISDSDKSVLKKKFIKVGFSAINFTDSRSVYQFYNLSRLWKDINIALDNGVTIFHPATEPVSAAEIYEYLSEKTFCNEFMTTPALYNYHTVYDALYGGKNGYISSKEDVLSAIKEFVEDYDS